MDPTQQQTHSPSLQHALQQQQTPIQQQAPVQVAQQATAQSTTIDNLTCQWQGCGERCESPEALYDHVCERHVGRKSTNNLNLTCQWGACRTTTVKRDHITSHIRVHVPLKPHKCDFCGKAFKRPQDLKKHVKTHADDSVLMNSPQAQQQNGRGSNGGMMGQPDSKSAASSYYPATHDTPMSNPYPSYQPNMTANGQSNGNYPQPTANGQYAGYGSVSYPNSSLGDMSSMDTRKRAIEALNDFLGDVKRRAINPGAYYDVGSRLQSNTLPLPVSTGYGYTAGTSNSYDSNYNTASLLDSFSNGNMGGGGGGAGSGGMQGPVAQGYSLPLPNARTKTDLQDIDRFLEQLQATVYETSNQAAAAGIQQPGTHAAFTGAYGFDNQNTYRSSNSPPNYQQNAGGMAGVNAMSSVAQIQNMTSTAGLDTPALTPASVSSYSSSAHSPMSSNGGRSSMGSMGYPNLPSVTGISDLPSGYPSTTSAPASGLASGFDGLDGRRYSGGRLQRQAPGNDTVMGNSQDTSGSRTPRASDHVKRPKSKGNSSIDPALRGEDERSSDTASTPAAISDSAEDKRQEEWVENIRVIEALRKWVAERLQKGEFDADDDDAAEGARELASKPHISEEEQKIVDTAKMVQERMKSVQAQEEESDEIKYPMLKSVEA